MSRTSGTEPTDSEKIVDQVRERYGRIAEGKVSGCCGPTAESCCDAESAVALGIGYKADELARVPEGANLGLGCGAPIGFLALRSGEAVVDLGSGAGFDALLAAQAVGPTGKVIGVDMTPEMLAKARANAARAGIGWVEFREGRLESLPVDDASVDAVTSNCVINLVPDKLAVFREVARILRPGGRLVVSDIVLDGELPAEVANDVLAWTGCVAGAIRREAYFGLLERAGLGDLTIHRDVDYLNSAGYEDLTDELKAKLRARGLDRGGLSGVVRSITYAARKRA